MVILDKAEKATNAYIPIEIRLRDLFGGREFAASCICVAGLVQLDEADFLFAGKGNEDFVRGSGNWHRRGSFVMQISIAVGGNEGHAGENTESSNSRPRGSIPPALPSLGTGVNFPLIARRE